MQMSVNVSPVVDPDAGYVLFSGLATVKRCDAAIGVDAGGGQFVEGSRAEGIGVRTGPSTFAARPDGKWGRGERDTRLLATDGDGPRLPVRS